MNIILFGIVFVNDAVKFLLCDELDDFQYLIHLFVDLRQTRIGRMSNIITNRIFV